MPIMGKDNKEASDRLFKPCGGLLHYVAPRLLAEGASALLIGQGGKRLQRRNFQIDGPTHNPVRRAARKGLPHVGIL